MPFGKHKGREVSRLPESYLWWLRENITLRQPLKSAIERILFPPRDDKETIIIYGLDMKQIQKTYRSLALKWHPDKLGGNTFAMAALNEFYEKLQEGLSEA